MPAPKVEQPGTPATQIDESVNVVAVTPQAAFLGTDGTVGGPGGSPLSASGTATAAAAIATGPLAPSLFHLPHAASAPAEPTSWQCYYDTALKKIGVYNGAAWVYTAALS